MQPLLHCLLRENRVIQDENAKLLALLESYWDMAELLCGVNSDHLRPFLQCSWCKRCKPPSRVYPTCAACRARACDECGEHNPFLCAECTVCHDEYCYPCSGTGCRMRPTCQCLACLGVWRCAKCR